MTLARPAVASLHPSQLHSLHTITPVKEEGVATGNLPLHHPSPLSPHGEQFPPPVSPSHAPLYHMYTGFLLPSPSAQLPYLYHAFFPFASSPACLCSFLLTCSPPATRTVTLSSPCHASASDKRSPSLLSSPLLLSSSSSYSLFILFSSYRHASRRISEQNLTFLLLIPCKTQDHTQSRRSTLKLIILYKSDSCGSTLSNSSTFFPLPILPSFLLPIPSLLFRVHLHVLQDMTPLGHICTSVFSRSTHKVPSSRDTSKSKARHRQLPRLSLTLDMLAGFTCGR